MHDASAQTALCSRAVDRLREMDRLAASTKAHGTVGVIIHYQNGIPQHLSKVTDLKEK